MIVVVDYCKGNLRSVERGLINAGAQTCITDDPEVIASADAVVLPGVGAFADASETMLKTGQMDAIRDAIAAGKPFLGICLGEHLLFDAGTEGATSSGMDAAGAEAADSDGAANADAALSADSLPEGLKVIPGIAKRIPEYDDQGVRYKVPHVGWNSIEFDPAINCPLLDGIQPGEYFYFTHSYIAPESDATIAITTHSITFPCVVQKGEAVFGVQFHPEKSSDAGAKVLENFVTIVKSKEQSNGSASCN